MQSPALVRQTTSTDPWVVWKETLYTDAVPNVVKFAEKTIPGLAKSFDRINKCIKEQKEAVKVELFNRSGKKHMTRSKLRGYEPLTSIYPEVRKIEARKSLMKRKFVSVERNLRKGRFGSYIEDDTKYVLDEEQPYVSSDSEEDYDVYHGEYRPTKPSYNPMRIGERQDKRVIGKRIEEENKRDREIRHALRYVF